MVHVCHCLAMPDHPLRCPPRSRDREALEPFPEPPYPIASLGPWGDSGPDNPPVSLLIVFPPASFQVFGTGEAHSGSHERASFCHAQPSSRSAILGRVQVIPRASPPSPGLFRGLDRRFFIFLLRIGRWHLSDLAGQRPHLHSGISTLPLARRNSWWSSSVAGPVVTSRQASASMCTITHNGSSNPPSSWWLHRGVEREFAIASSDGLCCRYQTGEARERLDLQAR
jgi:hypothetical protein